MKRKVESEWLDELPELDTRSLVSRRDIRRLNRIMGHATTLARLLESVVPATSCKRIVELGAGDGTFMLLLARRFAPLWPGAELVLVDCKNVVTDETRDGFAALGWKVEIVAADVFDFLEKPAVEPADVMLANLFLHQFAEAPLTRMLRLAAERTRVFAACEPRRAELPLVLSRLLGFIGCNDVTRHDAPVSVRAGFAGRELSALWPARTYWRLGERRAGIFSHEFLAERITGD